MFLKYLGFYHWFWKHRRHNPIVIEELCHQFSLASIKKSTNNYDKNRIIGSGSLGIVYKGCLQLHNDTIDSTVIIKRVYPITDKKLREFRNEIELLCQLDHPNLVNLLGYCDHKDEKIIVYDYNSNGSLYNLLCCKHSSMKPLTWKQRLKICIGVACGLHFLHTGTKRAIFHCDIHSHKILLDSNMVPKLSDFWISLQGPLFTSIPKPKSILNDNIVGKYPFQFSIICCIIISPLNCKD
jgi:serine/threonine protein kinase